jgi:hypothetical protein
VTEFRTPIPVEVIGKGPALAVGSVEQPGPELAWVCIAKDGGPITVEPVANLRGTGVYVNQTPLEPV